jgi:hypothetical protein
MKKLILPSFILHLFNWNDFAKYKVSEPLQDGIVLLQRRVINLFKLDA